MAQNNSADNSEIKSFYNDIMLQIQCENFVAIGHIIENMFNYNYKFSNKIIDIIVYLFTNNLINAEDIKHG